MARRPPKRRSLRATLADRIGVGDVARSIHARVGAGVPHSRSLLDSVGLSDPYIHAYDPTDEIMGWDLTYEMVGPRVPLTVTGTTFTTSYDGQVIEGLEVRDRINVNHNDVTIRDCRVRMTTYNVDYHIYINSAARNTVIEYCELVQDYPTRIACTGVPNGTLCWAGTPLPTPTHGRGRKNTPGVYSPGWTNGYWTLRWSYVKDVSRGPLLGSHCTVENNIIEAIERSDHAYDAPSDLTAGVHRSGLGCSFGGTDNVVRNNRIVTRMPNSSAAHSLYEDVNRIDRWTIENNYYDGGSFTLRTGEGDATAQSYIVVKNNRWGSEYYPAGHPDRPMGNFGPAAFWQPTSTGNEWHSTNAWLGAVEPLDPYGHDDGEVVQQSWVNV